MKKYMIVSFLEENPDATFPKQHWPLHVTILRPFTTSMTEDECKQKMATLCKDSTPIHTRGVSKELFGENKDILVTTLEITPSLQAIRDKFFSTFEPRTQLVGTLFGAYRPHVTDQLSGSLSVGDGIILHSASLVEMEEDHRKILATYTFE